MTEVLVAALLALAPATQPGIPERATTPCEDAAGLSVKFVDMHRVDVGVVQHGVSVSRTDVEDVVIRHFSPAGSGEPATEGLVVQGEPPLLPDRMIVGDSTLHVSSNPVNPQPQFHCGDDRREEPDAIFALELD